MINNLLIKAARFGNLKLVQFCLENGADIHALDDYTLRWEAATWNIEVVKYLVENAGNIHAKNDWALRYAAKRGNIEIMQYLHQLSIIKII